MFLFTVLLLLGCFLLVALICGIRKHRRENFFDNIGLYDYAGKVPQYRGQHRINRFIKRLRFKSSIPTKEWKKSLPDIEMYYRKKAYKIEQSASNLHLMDIYMIIEQLPTYIEWRDNMMEEGLRFAVGEGYMGKIVWDMDTLPHGLVAGATSSGKTSLLRCIIHQAILKRMNISVLDFKCGGDYTIAEREAQKYLDLKENYGPFIISDPEEARQTLLALTVEVRGRMEKCKEAGVSNISEYNSLGKEKFLSWLLVVDEAAEILDVKPKSPAEKSLFSDIDHCLRTLARMGRAAGVHILLGFIRPSADVLDGQIKNNLLWRACGYFSDPAASRIVLDNDRATELPPEVKGRFIIGEEEAQAYYMPTPKLNIYDRVGAGGEAER